MIRRTLILALMSAPLAPAAAQTADSAAVVATIEAFHSALAGQDSAAAVALLASDAVVLEGGHVESKAQYAAGHLAADMVFLAGVTRTVVGRSVVLEEDVAWVATSSHTDGTYNDRTVSRRGAELMVLGRSQDRWLIRAIHWSSGRR